MKKKQMENSNKNYCNILILRTVKEDNSTYDLEAIPKELENSARGYLNFNDVHETEEALQSGVMLRKGAK